jgi:hypothetical protein
VALLTPWTAHGRAAAVDSTALPPRGGGWHTPHKAYGEMPHSAIATDAGWSKAGGHSWWYGGQRHLAIAVGSVWMPLAADLPPAKGAENTVAPRLLAPLPGEGRSGLGDTPDHDPEVRQQGEHSNRALVATRRGASPPHAEGVDVRRLFQTLRSQAMEPCQGLLKHSFEGRTPRPVKGLPRSPRLA